MRSLIGIILLSAVLAVPLRAGEKSKPTGPMTISKWSIRWDRFKKRIIIDATFSNTSVKRVSDFRVTLEFFDDIGKLAKKSPPWRKSYLSGRAETRMKLRMGCPYFQMYRVRLSGKAEGAFQQIFEGKYWPDKPGDMPAMPEPVVFARGMADVRVTGSRTEYLKMKKGRESLKISGTVRNMGDQPAEHVVVTITLLDEKKSVWTRDIAIKAPKLAPRATAPFSVIVKRMPHYTKVTCNVDFDSVETTGKFRTIGKFDIEARPLIIKDCIIDSKTGLFTGTLMNKGKKIVTGIVVNISVEKAGATTIYKIKPAGDVKPGDSLSLIKTTIPEFDNFGVNVGFWEK